MRCAFACSCCQVEQLLLLGDDEEVPSQELQDMYTSLAEVRKRPDIELQPAHVTSAGMRGMWLLVQKA